jgi:hypothetical protein
MSETNTIETTQVTQVSPAELDDILGMPGAENIMLPAEEEAKAAKPSIFSGVKPDLSFIDKEEEEEEEEEGAKATKVIDPVAAVEDLTKFPEEGEEASKAGRPKADKSALLGVTNKLIEKKLIVPFDDEKPLEEYGEKDFIELFEANLQEKERELEARVSADFFEALPEELQYAAKYVADGGRDLKGLFKALSHVEESRSLDPNEEADAESIARNYLRATNFGSEDEIDDEIITWKDLGKLEQKAKQFKPKLDKMEEQVVAQQLAKQEHMRNQQQKQAKMYMENVYQTLEPGDLNGIKLDKKTQGLLYTGLVQANYPSISGRQTNLLGHLLEKYQYVEPRHDLIAEVLWHLADPDGFKEKIKDQGSTKQAEKTVRMLKTEESRKLATTSHNEEPDKKEKRGIPRPDPNKFFKR